MRAHMRRVYEHPLDLTQFQMIDHKLKQLKNSPCQFSDGTDGTWRSRDQIRSAGFATECQFGR